MELTALFPGSFDPFTLGHAAIAEQGLRIFDRIVIGVGCNAEKHGLLSIENRMRLISDLFKGEDRISVASYDGLTGDFCRELGIKFLLRGMRNTVDYEYERGVMLVNQMLYPEITTVLLFTPPQYVAISSSIIRELCSFGRDPRDLMPQGIEINDYI